NKRSKARLPLLSQTKVLRSQRRSASLRLGSSPFIFLQSLFNFELSFLLPLLTSKQLRPILSILSSKPATIQTFSRSLINLSRSLSIIEDSLHSDVALSAISFLDRSYRITTVAQITQDPTLKSLVVNFINLVVPNTIL